jgi:hypothetical protein
MDDKTWHIYVGEIPHSEKGAFWVSFESEPGNAFHCWKVTAVLNGIDE